jgi:hypothetical protein
MKWKNFLVLSLLSMAMLAFGIRGIPGGAEGMRA